MTARPATWLLALVLLGTPLSVTAQDSTFSRDRWLPSRPPWVIAHRGSNEVAPENTLAAFKLAVEEGADIVEMDCQATRDGKLVILHDETVDRTSDGHGPIADLTFEHVRKLDFSRGKPSYKGERIASLEEVCRWLKGTPVGLIVEAKTPYKRDPGLAERIAAMLESEGILDRALVEDFDERGLTRVHARWPDAMLGKLNVFKAWGLVPMLERAGAWAYLPDHRYVTGREIARLHASGYRVCVWTANEPAQWRRMIHYGADGIMTNAPGRLRRLLDQLGYGRRPWPAGRLEKLETVVQPVSSSAAPGLRDNGAGASPPRP